MGRAAADVFVAFGITGDLAKEMTFKSLYRLERRGLLHCAIVGVAADDWTVAQLRQRMRDAIRASGEKFDRTMFDALAERVSYIDGDFAKSATYERLATTIVKATRPLFYLETPPSLFGTVVKRSGRRGADQERARGHREAVRARPGIGQGAGR